MSSKRIHKTLEEIEAENEFESMHDELTGNFATYEESAQPTDQPIEEYERWDEDDPNAAFEALTGTAEPEPTLESTDRDKELKTSSRPRGRKPKPRWGPTPAIFAGTMITLGGFALAVISILAPGAAGPFAANLNAAGLTPGVILTLGLMILMVVAIVRRQQRTFHDQMAWVMSNQQTNAEILDHMIKIERRSGANGPQTQSLDEELEQLLHAVMRQDEKINNITKALKMFGKPLVEVNRTATENGKKTKMLTSQLVDLAERLEQSGQGADLSASIETLASRFDGIGDDLLTSVTEVLRQVSREGTDEMMKAVELFSEQVTSDVARVVGDLPKGQNSDGMLQTLQRELAALRDAVARAPLSTPVAAPVAAAPQSAPQPTPQAAPEPTSPSLAPPPGEGHASSISGTETTSGKNVLGAIAKLRKMR